MAKKIPAAEFNMSETIRELLKENPKITSQEASNAILARHPHAKINKNSFSVAFYTGRKKLGIRLSRRGGKPAGRPVSTGRHSVDLDMLQLAARFLREVGSADAAIEAIKLVQAIQVK